MGGGNVGGDIMGGLSSIAGLGMSLFGMPQAGIPMMTQGIGQLVGSNVGGGPAGSSMGAGGTMAPASGFSYPGSGALTPGGIGALVNANPTSAINPSGALGMAAADPVPQGGQAAQGAADPGQPSYSQGPNMGPAGAAYMNYLTEMALTRQRQKTAFAAPSGSATSTGLPGSTGLNIKPPQQIPIPQY